MPSVRQIFLQHVAQTSQMPLSLEIARAKGMYLYGTDGREYLDLNAGICVSSLGHCHPRVVEAIQTQAATYMHTMVYGEHIQSPQVHLAQLLAGSLPAGLDAVYFVNSGTEAVEGAMKLAKRVTGRYEIIAARNAYHGSTHGAESLRSDIELTSAFRPLVPGIRHIDFNAEHHIDAISQKTAAVILEPVQAEAGVISAKTGWLAAIRARCHEVGALLILDEIQTGYGRTGSLFALEQHDVVPDLLLTGKAMGGGMPIAAFTGSKALMDHLTYRPALGHITTFGGNPVTCAAGLACLEVLKESDLIAQVDEKARLFKSQLTHPIIEELRQSGLMMAVQLTRKRYLKHVVHHLFEQGALVDWFLFNQTSFRLAPPLIISKEQIGEACRMILRACDFAMDK